MAMKIVTSQTMSFEPIDEGVYDADITRLYEHTEFNRFSNEDKEGLRFEFTIVEECDMKGRKAYRFVNPFLTPKAILWNIWKAVKGGEPTAEELSAITSSDNLIELMGGKPIKIVVKNKTSARGNVYYTVSDFIKSNRKEGQSEFLPGAPEEKAEYKSNSTPPHPAETEEDKELVKAAEEVFGTDDELDAISKELDAEETGTVKKATPKRGE